MRFNKLIIQDKELKSSKEIEDFLYTSDFSWLLSCELDNVELEIIDNIIYWKSGIFYWGDWKWGIFEKGNFLSGVWMGGIFKGNIFKATWLNGVWMGETFDGDWKSKHNKKDSTIDNE